MKQDIFTEEFLKEIGFTLTEKKESQFKPYSIYGKAQCRIGLTILQWCEEGHSCTYFGDKLEPNTDFKTIEDLIPYNLEILKR